MNGAELVDSLRDQLRTAAPNYGDLVESTLVEAMQARKRATLDCPHCNRRANVEVLDSVAAVNAVKTMLEQVDGRPGVAEDVSQSAMIVRRVQQHQS